MPTLTTDFNGILTGEQLGHIHGENERYRCQLWFAQESLRKPGGGRADEGNRRHYERGPADCALRRWLAATRIHSIPQNGAPTHKIERQGRWKQGAGMIARYTRGETAGSALRYL